MIVDQTGNPVVGKTVTATFAGPAQQTPVTAKEDAATLGPGRYEIAVAALNAGSWKVTIAIGNEASGTYSLDVSR